MIDRALDAARASLPHSVDYGSYLTLPVCFVAVSLVSSCVTAAAVALTTRKVEPWFERARRVFALRVAIFGLFFFAPGATMLAISDFVGPFAHPSARVVFQLDALAALAAMIPAYVIVERAARGSRVTFSSELRNLGTIIILASNLPLTIVFVIPLHDFGVPAPLAALIAVALAHLTRVVVLRQLRRPARAHVAEAVRRAAGDRPGLAVSEITSSYANAFALRTRKHAIITFTTGAIDALSDAELEAVAAHELGHIDEAPVIWRLRYAMAFITDIVFVAYFVLRDSGHPGVALLVALATIVFNISVKPLLIRALEHRADHAARAHVGDSNYANAILRLHEINAVPLVLRRKGTHGHPYDRAAGAAGLPPTRPSAPSLLPASAIMFVSILGMMLVAANAMRMIVPACTTDASCTRAVAMTSGSTDYLVRLADARVEAKDPTAVMLYTAANEADPESRTLPLHAARRLLGAGRCHDALGMIHTLDDHWPGSKKGNDMVALRHDLQACYLKSVESSDVSTSVE